MATLNDPVVLAGPDFKELDVNFVVSPDKTAWVNYKIQMTVTAPLLSSQSIRVDLVADPDGDHSVLDSVFLSSAQNGGLSLLSLQTVATANLTSWVAPGTTLKLETTGSGTAVVISGEDATF